MRSGRPEDKVTASPCRPLRLLPAGTVAVAAAALCAASSALAAPAWHDSGPFEHTYDTNCESGGNENATAEYAGAYYDVSSPPVVGQVFYGRIGVYGLGDPCTGGFYAGIQVHLPPNTYLAISQANPVLCFYRLNDGATGQDTADCPQSPGPGDWANPSSGWVNFASPVLSWGDAWLLPTGPSPQYAPYWYIEFPMYSTKPLVGLSAPCDCLVGAVTAAGADSGQDTDGPPPGWNYNGTPSSGPYAPIFINSNPPTIAYPTPSSSAITTTMAHTTGYLYEHYTAGTAYVDLGTTTAYGRSTSFPIDGTADGSQVDQDWSGLAPGTVYHWRLRFVPSSGGTDIVGADQTFTTSSTAVPPAPVVATGTAVGVSQTAATITGTVNPNGSTVTGCHFDYGPTTEYGSTAPCAQTVGAGSTSVAVSAALGGLTTVTLYHYRLVATGAAGTVAGTDQTLTTSGSGGNGSGGGVSGSGGGGANGGTGTSRGGGANHGGQGTLQRTCSALRGTALADCNAREAYKAALAACERSYDGTGKAARARDGACRRRANTTYQRRLALIRCSSIANRHERARCTARARKVG
jgi:hypothetical protein